MRWAVFIVPWLILCAGCEGVLNEPDFERMIDQTNFRPYEGASWFSDGRAMRPPPSGTIPRERVLGPAPLVTGLSGNDYVADFPLKVDRALVERGRDRFEIYCSACHGVRGDGRSEVATNMELRRPPSLIDAPVRGFPPGRIFNVASVGYGLMPSFSGDLSVRDRWAVAAYVRALQLSASVPLDKLPAPLRDNVKRALP